eukprot:Nitzschia sp. Nitz4//scaffold9_size221794//91527//93025//NITZ4_001345-RA/size221794-snap-gene-0.99-mRNA-1//1//CDS//3329560998//4598//frame0
MASRNKILTPRRGPLHVTLRMAILGACLGWLSRKMLSPILFPFGPARAKTFTQTYADLDPSNDLLTAKYGKLSKIYERLEEGQPPLLKGPETVFFDNQGTMYTATENGNLISLTDFEATNEGDLTAKTTWVKDLGTGRPLGGKFLGDSLYVADSVLGLTRVSNVSDPFSKVEIVATTVVDNGKLTRIHFADDVAVSTRSGMVYFTDACEIYPERDRDMTWDVMYASKIEVLRGPSGRLLQYNPSTDEVKVLARDLYFANGVAVGEGEEYLLYVETFYGRVVKYYLSGEKEGTTEMVLDGYPSAAWFDGIDCGWNGQNSQSSYCYAVGVTTVVPLMKLIDKIPEPFSRVVRSMLMLIPKQLAPKPELFASIEILDPETLQYVGLIQDPYGKDISKLTGITLHDNKIYLGSLHNNYVGVYDLA